MKNWSRKIALAEVKYLREIVTEYEEECARTARNGWRPQTCIHGTNQWVDYDPICGACEEYGNTIPVYEVAVMRAHAREAEVMRRFELVAQAFALQVPHEVSGPILKWFGEATQVPDYLAEYAV